MNKVLIKNFKEARKESFKSDVKTAKIGAYAISNNRYKGYNTKKTHTRLLEIYGNSLSTHAEASVIFRAKRNVIKQLFVYREDSHGNIKKARPCKECLSLILFNGIKKIYYSINNHNYGVIKNNGILEESIENWGKGVKDFIQS
jgi:deoxycytidylate deaminase